MLKRDTLEARTKKAKKDLEKSSHDFIRQRDKSATVSWASAEGTGSAVQGNCFDCEKLSFGKDFQCGHWIPSSVGGALLRYHPWNMHGQASSCNCGYNQEMVKIRYTLAMENKYSKGQIDKLLELKKKTIKADIIFYTKLLFLYKNGDEQAIVDYLHSL